MVTMLLLKNSESPLDSKSYNVVTQEKITKSNIQVPILHL